MSRISLDEVLRYLKPYSRFEGIELDQFPIPASVHKHFPTTDKLKEYFVERCKKTPYSDRATTETSLYDRLQSLGVLGAILTDPIVEEIRWTLEVFEIEERQRALQGKHYSPHQFPEQFHRGLLYAIFRHVKQLRKHLKDYEVKEQRIAPYLKAAHELMIREARALFPMYPFGGSSYRPRTMERSWDDLIVSIFDIVFQALKAAGARRGRKELSIQLTKVVCSPSEFFHPGSIPTSAGIRTKVERRAKFSAAQSI
jgi:hypothetical protein